MPLPTLMPTPEDLQALMLAQETGPVPGMDYTTDDVAALIGNQEMLPPQGAGLQPGASLQPGDKQSASQGFNYSVTEQTPEGKAIAGDLGNLKGRTKAEVKRYNDEVRDITTNFDQAYGRQEQAVLDEGRAQGAAMDAQAGDTEQSLNAAKRAAQAMGIDPNSIQGSGEALRAVAQEQVLGIELQAAAEFKADMAGARAKFEGALARQEASGVDPGRIFRNPGVMWTGGIAAVAAVSNKAGNQNLAKSLMQTLDTAVRTDIEGQIANLNNQKSVTQGFQELWNMTRQDSLTDAENKHKIASMYYGTVESHINALALKEQSKVVQANYLSLAAEVQKKKVEEVTKALEARARIHAQRLETISQDARTAADVSVKRAEIGVRKAELAQKGREFDAAQAEKAKKEAAVTADGAVFDTTPDGGQVYLGQITGMDLNPDEAAKTKRMVQQTLADGSTAAESLSRLIDLNEKLRNTDTEGLLAMGFSNVAGARAELQKQIQSISGTLGAKLANAMGMTPISDTDVRNMQNAAGTEKVTEILLDKLGLVGTGSEKASAEVMSLIQRSARDKVRSMVRPAQNDQEIQAVRQRYGDGVMFEEGGAFVPIPKVTADGGLMLEETAVPVAKRSPGGREIETKKAPGLEAKRDYKNYNPNVQPGREAEAKGILEGEQPNAVRDLEKRAMEYKPNEDRGAAKDPSEVTPAYRKFAEEQVKGGNKLDSGKAYEVMGAVTVPEFEDEITELARIAHHSKDPDQQALATDALEAMRKKGGSRWHYAQWALEHPEEFTRKGTGRVTADIDQDE